MENLKNLEVAVEGFLAREPSPTPEKIRELIAWSEREFSFTSANRAHFEAALR